MNPRFPILVSLTAAAAIAGGCISERGAVRDQPRVDAPPPGPGYYDDSDSDGAYSYQTEAPPAPPAGSNVASEAVFYDQLAPYGYWTFVAPYGRVWVPAVAYGWRPYYYGRWVLTDWGWTFASDDPWGWAGYHYGRWNFAVGVGWYWIPGAVWAPAWVSWRYGAGYVTWCPLGPPGVVFGYRHPAWVAVPEAHFTRPIAGVAVPAQRTYGVVTQARPLTGPHATVGRGGSFGPPVASVSRATGQQIHPVAVAQPAQVARPRPSATPAPVVPMRSPVRPGARVDAARPTARPSYAPHPMPARPAPTVPRMESAPPPSYGGGSAPRVAPPPPPSGASGGGAGPAPHASPPSGGGSAQPHATTPKTP